MAEQTASSTLPIMVQPSVRAVASSEDNWKGKTSPAERRKIQNRLNQRTWRQRQKLEKLRQGTARGAASDASLDASTLYPSPTDSVACKGSITNTSTVPSSSPSPSSKHNTVTNDADYIYTTAMELSRPSTRKATARGERACAKHATLMALTYIGRRRALLDLKDEDMEELYSLFLMKAASSGTDPMSDWLLPLVQFNLFRGLMENMKILGITMPMVCDEDSLSPFGTDPSYNSSSFWNVPVYLRPTETQLTIEHHPWLDFLPLPRMRDNLIKADGNYDDEELCLDMIGDGNAPSGKGEVILWGDAWDPMNWEVTEVFVTKWRWVLEGCEELIRSSNYWRAQRGENKMRVRMHGCKPAS
ncbi:uncharacterized protein CTRU02_210636 [Colletotrichum truncatum]|uniref:Uncharacterized protein n=1 Tax=Colletotrichum truncatum TaxID=5467 RepID=A0ACC3YPS2_COLTU|nr:uncharacterized protein CTRU02_03868 [Colletotrichum truncatum]KAF6796890.1 hypothetical protein CTRU02_03868 [Colletotrichum truncatum]